MALLVNNFASSQVYDKVFAIYIDDLIVKLRSLKNGCYIADIFLACIVYADDICLLAPTRSAMQLLLNTCEEYGISWCLTYNPKKTKVMMRPTFINLLTTNSCAQYVTRPLLELELLDDEDVEPVLLREQLVM